MLYFSLGFGHILFDLGNHKFMHSSFHGLEEPMSFSKYVEHQGKKYLDNYLQVDRLKKGMHTCLLILT
jgi:hypothetical protein